MTRLFPDFAYGPGPRDGCWWDETIVAPDWPQPAGALRADVAIIGGGFTGISAALHLAERGVEVALFEAETPGWGASGRNGGFCCLGGAKIGAAALERQVGKGAALAYWRAEADAVWLARALIERFGIVADTHSEGETQLAHSRRQMDGLRRAADEINRIHGVSPEVIPAADLPARGMGGPFHGAMTVPIGFALNPRKYLFGLAQAAQGFGARLFQRSRVTRVERRGQGLRLHMAEGTHVDAAQVIVATNGYSSDDLPAGLAGRYMPAQSNVLVTRPLTAAEQEAQGWRSAQMAYDTRNLLHYFRLMPDGRFLFGLRGGLLATPRAEAAARRAARRDFEMMFPRWAHVPSAHAWSGLVCLSQKRVPFVGPIPGEPGVFAGFAYHGNGVAMGTYAGRALADLVVGSGSASLPAAMTGAPGRFPFGRWRRVVMPPIYLALWLRDVFG